MEGSCEGGRKGSSPNSSVKCRRLRRPSLGFTYHFIVAAYRLILLVSSKESTSIDWTSSTTKKQKSPHVRPPQDYQWQSVYQRPSDRPTGSRACLCQPASVHSDGSRADRPVHQCSFYYEQVIWPLAFRSLQWLPGTGGGLLSNGGTECYCWRICCVSNMAVIKPALCIIASIFFHKRTGSWNDARLFRPAAQNFC